MAGVPIEEREDFPDVGARARRLMRFEHDLRAWLETPDGRFAAWHARRLVEAEAPEPTPRAHSG
jgi:hypothetical protein